MIAVFDSGQPQHLSWISGLMLTLHFGVWHSSVEAPQLAVSFASAPLTIPAGVIFQVTPSHHQHHLVPHPRGTSLHEDTSASNGMSHLCPTAPGTTVRTSTFVISVIRTHQLPTSTTRHCDVQNGTLAWHKGHHLGCLANSSTPPSHPKSCD